MPIYEYRCSSCDAQKDVMQKISDAPLTTCPECGKETLAKQITAAGFQLKGSGYYATDFKDKPASQQVRNIALRRMSGCGRQCVKKYLLTGLIVWVPLGITLWVLNLTIGTLDQSTDLVA